jgi:hypothetical protein
MKEHRDGPIPVSVYKGDLAVLDSDALSRMRVFGRDHAHGAADGKGKVGNGI